MKNKLCFFVVALFIFIYGIASAQTIIFSENFEGVTPPLLPAGWSAYHANPDGVGDADSASNLFLTGDSVAISSAAWNPPAHTIFVTTNDDNCNCDKSSDYLEMPPVNLTGYSSCKLQFESYMSGDLSPIYLDSAFVEVSTDSGSTWTRIYALNKVASWNLYTVDISAYDGVIDVRIRFHYNDLGNWGYGLSVDDITIFEPSSNDLGVIAINAPVSGCDLSASESVTIRVTNFGTAAQNTIPVAYWVDGGTPVNDTIAATINPGDTAIFTFVTGVDLSAYQTYVFYAWTANPGDTVNNNDTLKGLQVDNDCYCTPTYTNGCGPVYTNRVEFAGIDNSASGTGCNGNPDAHIYYHQDTGTVNRNGRFVVTLTPDGLNSEGFGVWIDFNNNKSFADPGEFVFFSGPTTVAVSDTILIPINSITGTTRMRVRVINNGFNTYTPVAADSCNNQPYGETEDYPIRINPELPDVGVITIDGPVTSCGLTASESITVRVVNFALSDTAAFIPVRYRINGGGPVADTITTSLNPGDTISFTFATTADLSTPGNYTIEAWTSALSDSDNNNDSASKTVTSILTFSSFPYIEDFEMFVPGFPESVDPGIFQNGWTNAIGDSIDWLVDTNGTISGTTGPNVDHTSGTASGKYLYVEATDPNFPNKHADLISPCIDISPLTTPRLSFWYHMYGPAMGNLYIDISTSGSSGPWTALGSLMGQQQDSSGAAWKKMILGLSSYSGIVNFRWRGLTGSGYTSDIAIDDVNVLEAPANDMELIGIFEPDPSCGTATATDTVKIGIKNAGSASQSNIPVGYRVGATTVYDTIPGPIAPGGFNVFKFASTVDLSANGIYYFDAWVGNPGDSEVMNDSALDKQVIHHVKVASFPYLENFESGQGGWFADGINSSWAFGSPVKTTINSAASGSNSWVTGGLGSGQYNSEENSYVIGPCFDLSILTNPAVKMNIWWNSDFSWDGAALQASTDVGVTWQTIGSFGDAFNWYNDSALDVAPGGQKYGWTGSIISGNGSGSWVSARHLLNGLGGQASVVLRFVFASDFATEDDGFAFDDVEVYEAQPDAGISLVISPVSGCGLTASEPITVRIKNYGELTLVAIPVAYNVNGGSIINDTVTPVPPGLAPGDSIDFTFSTTTDMSAQVVYLIDIWTSLSGDTVTNNDSTTNVVVDHNCYCKPTYAFQCNTGVFINRFVFAGIDNTPAGTGCNDSSGSYIYFYNDTAKVYKTYSYNFSITNSGFGDGYGIWIDYNANGTFADSGEFVFSSAPNGLVLSGSINIPASATTGITRMRVRSINGATPAAIDSCNNQNYGETEDYNIMINPQLADDLGIFSIDAPQSACQQSATQTISVKVKNFGTAPQTGFTLSYRVNNGAPVNEVVGSMLNSGDTLAYTFTTTANMSTPGIYNIDAWSSLTIDQYMLNDSTLNHIFVNNIIASACIFDYDTVGGVDTNCSFTQSLCNDQYVSDSSLKSETIFINTRKIDSIQFLLYYTECISGDTTEFLMYLNGNIVASYSDTTSECTCNPSKYPVTVTLSDSATIHSAYQPGMNTFSVRSTDSTNLFIAGYQALVFGNCLPAADVGVVSFVNPLDPGCGLSSSEPIIVKVVNFGSVIESNIPIAYKDAFGFVFNEVIPGPLNPSDTVTYTFAATYDMSATGTYSFDAWTAVPIEYNKGNDSIYGNVITNYVLSGTTSKTDLICNAVCNGSASVTVAGGTTPYTYLWDDTAAQTDSLATGLCAGSYVVTTTDVNNCQHKDSITITEPTALSISTGSVNSTCGNPDGVAYVLVTGGTGTYTYLWDDPASQTADTASGLLAGTYNVTVNDSNGCVKTAIVSVNDFGAPTVSVTSIVDVICNGESNGEMTATASGGTGAYTYLWNDASSQSTAIVTGLTVGIYSTAVTDSVGCVATATDTVKEPPLLTIMNDSVYNVLCNGGSSGAVYISATGGVTAYSYSWSNGATTEDITGLTAGTYTVTVTDANSCTKTASQAVTEPIALSISTSGTAATCNGICDGIATVTVSGGTVPYNVLWSDPLLSTTLTTIGLCAGTYNVTITDANSCTKTASYTVTEPAALLATTSGNAVSCNGNCNGSVSVVVSGGTTSYSYLWNDPTTQTTATATGLCAGVYTITVTDANGCFKTDTTTVNEPAVLSAYIVNITHLLCNSVCNGIATASATGGTAPFSYKWSDPLAQSDTTATGLCAGVYNVTVTDSKSCSATTSATVTEPTAISLSTTATNSSCGVSNGTATATASGGTGTLAFLWNDSFAQTTSTASGLASGAYNVTATDTNGCMKVASASVNDAGAPTATIASSTNVACNGDSSGSATVSATGGSTPYVYLWTDPASQTTTTASGLKAGLYSVTITDSLGCKASTSVSITEPAVLSATIISAVNLNCNALCNGSSTVKALGGTAPYNYKWSDPLVQSDTTATGLCASTYSVTVTDSKGCEATTSVTLSEPTAITVSTTATNSTCLTANGTATATASGGTTPYSYLWNDSLSQTTSMASGLKAGAYNVTVTDGKVCMKVTTVSVNDGGTLAASVSSSTNVVGCKGDSSGSATGAATGGTSPYLYSWNDPASQATENATGLKAGLYSITVTDSLGCKSSASIAITEPDVLSANIISTNDLNCNAVCDGSAMVKAFGGTVPYTYKWSDLLAQSDTTATGLCAGTYSVTVTDSKGCSANTSSTLTQPTALTATITTSSSTCGSATGSATVTASGGTTSYTYLWNDSLAQQTATATGLKAGAYNVTVTDSKGCKSIAVASVNDAGAPTASITSSANVKCSGDSTGTATASVTGGQSPYTYSWNDPLSQGTATATGLKAGVYGVTVTDSLGCKGAAGVTITQPAAIAVSLTIQNTKCSSYCDGSATANVTGGTGTYSYLWFDPSSQTTVTATGLCTGFAKVEVTDSAGCATDKTGSITSPAPISLAFGSTNATCGATDGSAFVSAAGGISPYTYLWNDTSSQSTDTAKNIGAGAYIVTVTDANGCSMTESANVSNNGAPTVSIASSTGVKCKGGNDGSASLTVSGGVTPYTYLWSDAASQSGATATGLLAVTYNATVTDSAGCKAIVSATITEPNALALAFSGLNPTCGGVNGMAMVKPTGGTSPYTYLWDDAASQTKDTASGLASGIYRVTVTDSQGCTAKDSVTLTGTSALTLTLKADSATSGSNGAVYVTVSGGTSPYSYVWNDLNTTTNDTVTGLGAGMYTVVVTDSNGCVKMDSAEVKQGTGVEGFRIWDLGFRIYPNPTDGMFDVEISLPQPEDVTLTVTNLAGETVHVVEFKSSAQVEYEVNLKSLPGGVYQVTLRTAEGVYTKRLVISR